MGELSLAVEGPSAPPRSNGEIAFDAPWQSRVFGLTAALVEADRLSWADFQHALIVRVGAADATGVDDYWGSWSEALGDCCSTAGLVTAEGWQERTEALAARPAGHDHDHADHSHGEHDHVHH